MNKQFFVLPLLINVFVAGMESESPFKIVMEELFTDKMQTISLQFDNCAIANVSIMRSFYTQWGKQLLVGYKLKHLNVYEMGCCKYDCAKIILANALLEISSDEYPVHSHYSGHIFAKTFQNNSAICNALSELGFTVHGDNLAPGYIRYVLPTLTSDAIKKITELKMTLEAKYTKK